MRTRMSAVRNVLTSFAGDITFFTTVETVTQVIVIDVWQ